MIVSLPLYIGLNFFQPICGFIYFQVLSCVNSSRTEICGYEGPAEPPY